MGCDKPVMFGPDPSVCETCGGLIKDHETRYLPYKEAIWRVLLRHGGVWSYYGGCLDTWETAKVRLHFGLGIPERDFSFNPDHYGMGILAKEVGECEIDLKKSGDPHEDFQGQFDGTFASNSTQIAVITGDLTCKCRRYERQTLSLPNKTIGQMIWLSVNEGKI